MEKAAAQAVQAWEEQRNNFVKVYLLSPTEQLASQLGFDEIDKALFRMHELLKKEDPMLFAAFHDSTTRTRT
jgi:hypothetical protein